MPESLGCWWQCMQTFPKDTFVRLIKVSSPSLAKLSLSSCVSLWWNVFTLSGSSIFPKFQSPFDNEIHTNSHWAPTMHQSLCSVYIKSAYLPLHSPRGSINIPTIQTEKWRPPQREGEKNIPATEKWGTLWLIQHVLSVYSTQGLFLKKISLLLQSEFFLPGQSSYQKGEGGGDVETESGAGGCETSALG